MSRMKTCPTCEGEGIVARRTLDGHRYYTTCETCCGQRFVTKDELDFAKEEAAELRARVESLTTRVTELQVQRDKLAEDALAYRRERNAVANELAEELRKEAVNLRNIPHSGNGWFADWLEKMAERISSK